MSHTVTVRIARAAGDCEATIMPIKAAGDGAGRGKADPALSAQGETFPVAEALDRARALLGAKPGMLEVVVLLSDGVEWNAAWGELI